MTKESRVQLELRTIGSPDIEFYAFEPESIADVFFLVELEIGEKGVEGADLFQVVVATPEALRKRAKDLLVAERGTLVVSEYNWPRIEGLIKAIVRRCQAESWVASTIRLQRYFRWEYEDYQVERDV